LPGIANAAQQTWTEGNQVALSTNLKGSARTILQDAALNDRGVNVTAANAALVDVSASTANATAGLISVKLDQTTQGTTNAVSGAKTNNAAAPGATNVGALVAIANAAAPTYSEGNEVLLSTDLAGLLRTTNVDSAPATQNITALDTATVLSFGANQEPIYTGTATTNSSASFAFSAYDSAKVQVTGAWAGTLQVEVSFDSGTTWYQQPVHVVGTNIFTTSFNGNFGGGVSIESCTNLRVRAVGAFSGTATVKVILSTGVSNVYVSTPLKIGDSTGSAVTSVRPSNSPAQKTDSALVVTVRDEDPSVKGLLESVLLELQAANANAGISPTDVNQYKTLDSGKQVVSLTNTRGRIKTATITLSSTTTETTLIPAVPGEVHDLLAIWMINTSAATNTRVDIRDATAGLTVYPFQPTPVGPPVGISLGGVVIPQGAANQNWTAQCATSTADVRITAVYSVNNL
jgi:hypothetical protein